jgi:6-phosphogluconolactonase
VVKLFSNHLGLSQAAAKYVYLLGRKSVARRGRFDLLLAGGKTPCELYRLLSEGTRNERSLWRNTHIYWGDERAVGAEHPESNYGMARECLLDRLELRPEQVHRIEADGPDLAAAAEQYEQVLPERVDVLLLGVGADGHTASLFPCSLALKERSRRAMAIEAPVEPKLRVTVTPAVIAAARNLVVAVSGSDKAAALRRVFDKHGDVDHTPARLARRGTWFVDHAAAQELMAMGLVSLE